MKTSSSSIKLFSALIGFVVVVAILVTANILFRDVHMRKDITQERLYTLSDGTREILQDLPGPVTLKFFFNRSDAEVPVQLKGFADRVEDLLKEYGIEAKGNVLIEKFDPRPDSDAEEWAQKYGLSGQSMGFMGPTLYMGLVASMGGRDEAIPFMDPRTEDLLEYNITRMIARVSEERKPVIGVISSLPVMGERRPPMPMPGMPEPSPAWFVIRDLKEDYEVREITPPVESIADDVDALLVIHPKDLKDGILFAIDQFVLRGGNLMVFVDPACLVETDNPMVPPQMRFSPKSSSLPKLFEAWGVTYDPGKVVADVEAASRVRMGQSQVEESLVWLSLRRSNMNPDDILTSHVESIMMPNAGCFSVAEAKDMKVTPLISSSESAGLVDAMTAQFGGEGVKRTFKKGLTRLHMAVRLQGKMKTAFPGGKPEEEPEAKDGEETDNAAKEKKTPGPGLQESKMVSSVVLVGDVDMLYDRFCVQEVNFMGYRGSAPMNDNVTLFANMTEQLAGGRALASIRTRGKTDRPFKRVLDLQRVASERYMEKELSLQQELEEAQRRLDELDRQKDQQQRLFLSDAQKREIDSMRMKVVSTKQELKRVRRDLREGIEKLGVKVKMANILMMPILVALGGIGFSTYRRLRMKS